MTRYLIKLISRISFGCIIIVLLALGVGHKLPYEDEIAFASNFAYGAGYKTYIMALNRRNMVSVNQGTQNTYPETWSPIGEEIVISEFRDGSYASFEMNLFNGTVHQLTDGQHLYSSTRWSPDGWFLIYQTISTTAAPSELILYDLQAGTSHQLTFNSMVEFDPSWSPDSQNLVFTAGLPSKNNDIYELNIQTGTIRPLIVSDDNKYSPSWSPDGHYLFYTVNLDTAYLWDSQNNHSILLLEHANLQNTIDWSPDARFIIYAATEKDSNSYIYMLEIEKCIQQPSICQPKRLFSPMASYTSPRWRPN